MPSATRRASLDCSGCRCSCSRKATIARRSRLFPQIAKLTRGAYCKFDRSSPDQLKRLLGAVAAYAAGGRAALLKYGKDQGGVAALLTNQMK